MSAPMDPVQHGSRIGRADLEQARELLSRARNDLEPRQWEALDGKLTATEQAFENFSRAAKASGQAAEVGRGAEGLAQAERLGTLAEFLPRVGPLLVGLVLLYPSHTAGPESDRRPEWLDAQLTQEEDDPRCRPIPLPRHLGGHDPHNECADKLPGNTFPGGDVLVNGKNFDALQLATRTLWEVKTDDLEKQPPRSRRFLVEIKLSEMQREQRLAAECGFQFNVGVRSEEHKAILRRLEPNLNVVVTDWC